MKHVFVSPHYDDAIWSCGGLICELRIRRIEVLLVTIFNAERFVGECPGKLAQKYIKEDLSLSSKTAVKKTHVQRWEAARSAENRAACKFLGVRSISFGFLDGVLELDSLRVSEKEFFAPRTIRRRNAGNSTIENTIVTFLEMDDVVYMPSGFGGHPDHILICRVTEKLRQAGYTIIFYAEQPYCLSDGLKAPKGNGWISLSNYIKGRKSDACLMYKTQCRWLLETKTELALGITGVVRYLHEWYGESPYRGAIQKY